MLCYSMDPNLRYPQISTDFAFVRPAAIFAVPANIDRTTSLASWLFEARRPPKLAVPAKVEGPTF